jgi:hypothetical protein
MVKESIPRISFPNSILDWTNGEKLYRFQAVTEICWYSVDFEHISETIEFAGPIRQIYPFLNQGNLFV